LHYVEKPKENFGKGLRNKSIPMVKILWEHHGVQDTTWENEEWMRRNDRS
jgi:hypothetical protein